jgi:hypothetical protein
MSNVRRTPDGDRSVDRSLLGAVGRDTEVHDEEKYGNLDRGIRIVVALVIGVLLFTGRLHGTPAIVLGVIAVVFLGTSLIGWCPSYIPLKISTCKTPAAAKK